MCATLVQFDCHFAILMTFSHNCIIITLLISRCCSLVIDIDYITCVEYDNFMRTPGWLHNIVGTADSELLGISVPSPLPYCVLIPMLVES